MQDDTLELTLLLDYYGPLLTEKQRTYCDLHCNQDYSLAEIAEQTGISRQGVHASLIHAEALLHRFEGALGYVAAGARRREAIAEALASLAPLMNHADPMVCAAARDASAALQSVME